MPGATAAPRNVAAIVINSTAITVQWDHLYRCRDANGNITMYRVQFQGQPRETLCRNIDANVSIEVSRRNNTSGQTTVTVTPFIDYSIQVAAVNEEGDVGVYSSAVTRTTPEGGEAAACGRYIHSDVLAGLCSCIALPHRFVGLKIFSMTRIEHLTTN